MTKVSKSFVCTVEAAQINQLVWIMDRTSMDIGDGASLELMNKFCYVGDMLSVNGDADAAVEARVHKGWNKFRQLVPPLTNKHVSLLMRGKLHTSCVHSCMLHDSETWPVKKQNELTL